MGDSKFSDFGGFKWLMQLIEAVIVPGTPTYTDEYNIYCQLREWGYQPKTVNHGSGEYARDEDGDSFHEVQRQSLCLFERGRTAIDFFPKMS